MSRIIQFAKDFALLHHGEQDHGCLKIGEHLADVASHVSYHAKKHSVEEVFHDTTVAAAWLHDIVEDTSVTSELLEDVLHDAHFNFDDVFYTTQAVRAVTDKAGRGRKERHLKTYWQIRDNPRALLIKLCDRRHNHERSIKHGEIYAAMYAKEFDYFKFALWRPDQYKDLWAELDRQNNKMQEMLG